MPLADKQVSKAALVEETPSVHLEYPNSRLTEIPSGKGAFGSAVVPWTVESTLLLHTRFRSDAVS